MAVDLVSGQHGHHLGQDAQYLPGQVLRVFKGLLCGLLLGVVSAVSDLDRASRGEPGSVHQIGDQSTNSQVSPMGSHARGSGA